MKLQQLKLIDFRPFRTLNIEFGEQLTVLVGVNGTGKTSVLDALTIMLSRLFARIRSTSGTGRFFTDAVPVEIYNSYFQRQLPQTVIQRYQFKLVIYDIDTMEIVKWIN